MPSASSACWRCRSTRSWSSTGLRWPATSLCTETDWEKRWTVIWIVSVQSRGHIFSPHIMESMIVLSRAETTSYFHYPVPWSIRCKIRMKMHMSVSARIDRLVWPTVQKATFCFVFVQKGITNTSTFITLVKMYLLIINVCCGYTQNGIYWVVHSKRRGLHLRTKQATFQLNMTLYLQAFFPCYLSQDDGGSVRLSLLIHWKKPTQKINIQVPKYMNYCLYVDYDVLVTHCIM